MAVVGYAMIRPTFEAGVTPHYIHDITVSGPASQDGVWSTPDTETVVENLTVFGAGGGLGAYQLRIGVAP